MTASRLEIESRCQECLAITKKDVISNNLLKRRVWIRMHAVVREQRLVIVFSPISM